ncbi:MAG: DinB family protein [Candidatus Dormibacteraeota bacterium]|nr:DinB family protein [Candidatus Dormibacteraeota bacterium]
MDQLLIEAFRYHKWANLQLLDVCSKLTEEQLLLTAPGTYGTIAATFQHLLGAEQRYLRRLDGGEPAINEKDEFPGIDRLRELASGGGDRLIEAASKVTPQDTVDTKFEDGFAAKLHLGVVVIQALHHGNDHRTHVCTILGHHGIPYGDMDVWAYGDASGAIVPIPAEG